MSRFLFVVPPLTGHVNAPLAVGHELVHRGHELAWVGPETYLRPLVGPDITVFPTGLRLYRPQADRGMSAIRSLWQSFVVPFARFILPAVERAVQDFRPDVVAVDQHAVAGAVVAHKHGLRWASLAPQSMELTRPFAAYPKVDGWIRDLLGGVSSRAGLSPDPSFDPRFSPYLVIAFTGTALTGDCRFAEHFRLVGPSMAARLDAPPFPWESLDPARRRVVVTVGTLSEAIAADFYTRVMAAVEPLRDTIQVVVVAEPDSLPASARVAARDHLVVPRVPMLELMPHLDAVVCHGGLNTVCEALAHDLPLVIAPIRNDQPIIANQVVAAGAGMRVRFARATPEVLRTAIATVLDVPSYRDAAARVGTSLRAAGGAAAAARHLEELAGRP
jgi:zeaxanthin glucosyltransferase